MAIKRVVDIGFWTDGKFDEFTPEDKYFLLYLLTNPFSRQLGIYKISIKQAAFQMGYSEDAFRSLIDRFEKKYKMILFSKETNEIAVVNFLRHSVVSGGKPVEDCIKQDMERVKNRRLIDYVFSRIRDRSDLNKTVKKIVDEYLNENDIYNDNDNDNDSAQGASVHESWDESSNEPEEPKPKPPKPKKHKHGEYNNVLLTDEELQKLQNEYPDWAERIERLSSYVASTGKSYKSHYATIRNWARNDKQNGSDKNGASERPADSIAGRIGTWL